MTKTLKFTQVADEDRLDIGPKVFKNNLHWMRFENFVFTTLDDLSTDYNGGYWEFYTLENGGFFMAPSLSEKLQIGPLENYFEGEVSSEAAGIIACLYAYSNLSFQYPEGEFGELYHKLLDLAYEHPEGALIMGAID